ncbi:hypothetical protein M422DRAFT_776541 [Sphaerobolus stellatus SS14]|nr:hypothetical protein M422DRAFT_776541 [Sphaerobolus stellatus SS14]
MVQQLLQTAVPQTTTIDSRPSLDPKLCAVLGELVKGSVFRRGEPGFDTHSKLFNGDVKSPSSILVRPFDTADVSQIVKFCSSHSLAISVKGGGLGTHGQAVQGDVIIDLSLLNNIAIEPPNQDGGFTSLRDMDASKRAGKGRADTSSSREESQDVSRVNLGKRSADVFSQESSSTNVEPSNSGSNVDHDNRGSKLRRTGDSPVRDRPEENSSNNTAGALPSLSARGPQPAVGSSMAAPQTYQSNTSRGDPFGYLTNDLPASVFQQAPRPLRILDQPQVPSFPQHGLSMSLPFLSGFPSSADHYMPSRVNLISLYAYMSFGAGTLQQELDAYGAAHPLPALTLDGAPCFAPYHIPLASHPGGASVLLLGGFGFLSRLHGLSSDHLMEVEMVLADGSVVIANEKEHPDLWWAVRGAGPAFGIVTRYKAKAFPVPVVFAGNLLYKFRRSTAASLIKHFRDCVKNVPRELYANVVLTAGPGGDAILVIEICYIGGSDKGSEFLQAVAAWDGETCLLNDVCEKSFLVQQESFSQLLRGKAGRKWFIRSDLITTLSDDIIHETVIRFSDSPVGCTWLFELAGGCVSDEHESCFPSSLREAAWVVTAFHQWELDEDDPRCVTTAVNWMKDTLGKASLGGPLPSFYGIHEPMDRIIGSFGENWPRLCELKRQYDPNGLFHNTFWPLDKEGQPMNAAVATITEF